MIITEEHRANALAISKKQLKDLRKKLGFENADSRKGVASAPTSEIGSPKDLPQAKSGSSSVKK